LSSNLFDWKEPIEYNGNHDAFVNEKAVSSALDRIFKATDSINDKLNELNVLLDSGSILEYPKTYTFDIRFVHP
jgi:hypothetical protein